MNVDRITGPLLLRTIRDLTALRKPPPEILTLHLYQHHNSDAAKIHALECLLHDIAWDELCRLRVALDVKAAVQPATCDELMDAVRADMQAPYRSGELFAWSALYHRYLAPICLSSEEIAPIAGVSPRNYRRWISEGIERLAIQVQRLELAARGDA